MPPQPTAAAPPSTPALYENGKSYPIQNQANPNATIKIVERVYPRIDKLSRNVQSHYSEGYIVTTTNVSKLGADAKVFAKVYLPSEDIPDDRDQRADREVMVYKKFTSLQTAGSIPTLYGDGKFHFKSGQPLSPLILLSIPPGTILRKNDKTAKTAWTKDKLMALYPKVLAIYGELNKEIQKTDVPHTIFAGDKPCVFDFDRAILKTEGGFDATQDQIDLAAYVLGLINNYSKR